MRTEGGTQASLEKWASDYAEKAVYCCHRLDSLTSGLVLLRKNRRFTRELAQAFEDHRVKKVYWALVQGEWPQSLNRLDAKLKTANNGMTQVSYNEGKESLTTARRLRLMRDRSVSWIELTLKTGRTHQARVHCAHAGYPILGDSVYGKAAAGSPFGLHARELRFRHPASGESLRFVADTPAEWHEILRNFGSD